MPFEIRHHATAAAVAAAISASSAGYVVHQTAATPPLVVHTSHQKLHAQDWPGLSDDEAKRLAANIKALPPKTISVFCASAVCSDLAEDFIDAFEDAGWVAGLERPVVDVNTGINVGPDVPEAHQLAAAIEAAVSGRFKVGILSGKLEDDRLGIVISRKPR